MFKETDIIYATVKSLNGLFFTTKLTGAKSLKDIYHSLRDNFASNPGLVTVTLRNVSQGVTNQYHLMNL